MTKQLIRTTQLKGALTIGLGSILGTGAYVSVGLGASIAGESLIWAILLAAFTALCNGLSSAQLAAAHPVSGGTYEYGYRFLNPASGVTAGALFIIAKSASAATAALAVAWYVNSFFAVSEWLIKASAICLLLLLTIFVLLGVRRTNRLNAVIVAASVLGLLVFIGVAFNTSVNTSAVKAPVASGSLSVFHAAALMFVAFTGYGRIATMGEEIAEPRRNIPRAVILTLIIVSVLYIMVGLAILHMGRIVTFDQNGFNIANLMNDSPWQWLVSLGGIVAMSGVVLNLVLGVSRVILAMGRRGDLPTFLAQLDKDSKSAPAATWVTFLVMAFIALTGGIESTWTLSAFTVLIYYGITNIAALKVSHEERFIPKALSVVGLISCAGLVILAALA
ncbi:amino acid permease [Alteromonas pelagimontana]|uniref:Amino acid permease n=1 Tax=Alteromonas pelagimontana TaxID=1858656 RepID=A0A6M4MDL2_9ALTE|nr:APC family permease [Alteromonas pelagimontana]QJR81189.1 amino acid permease [Alteromonas pelagimontana]